MAIAAIAAAIPALFSMAEGANQKSTARSKLGQLEANRPQYEIPQAAKNALALVQSQIGDMPGTAVEQQRIDMTAANMVQAAMQTGNPLGALGAIQANQTAAGLNLATSNARFRTEASYRAADAMNQYAQYKDMEFQMNEYAPWKDQYQLYENMYGAGSKNVHSGLDSFSQIASAALSK